MAILLYPLQYYQKIIKSFRTRNFFISIQLDLLFDFLDTGLNIQRLRGGTNGEFQLH